MYSDIARDIATVLEDSGIGVFASSSDWGIYVHKEPTDPINCITIYDLDGSAANTLQEKTAEYYLFQVRVRCSGFVGCREKLDEIDEVLNYKAPFTLDTTRYTSCTSAMNQQFLGYNDNNQAIMVKEYRGFRKEI